MDGISLSISSFRSFLTGGFCDLGFHRAIQCPRENYTHATAKDSRARLEAIVSHHPNEPRSTVVLGLIAGVGLCLLVVGLGLSLSPLTSKLLAYVGLMGLLSAVGLESSARKGFRQQRDLLASRMSEARTDPLTGLADGQALNLELGRRIAQWQRQGTPVSLLLVDVDQFKQLNDEHGRKAADKMLWIVAHTLCAAVREMDVVTRFGKQRFAVVLPGTSLSAACRVAERTRGIMADNALRFWGNVLRSTVSIGVARVREGDDTESLVQRAHAALSAAKRAGGDQVYLRDARTCLPVLRMASSEPAPVPEC